MLQTYWMYTIWCCIQAMPRYDMNNLDTFEKKCKSLVLPEKYIKMLNLMELECLDSLLITPLIKMVSEYYGLMDRNVFLHCLIKLEY